MVPLAAGVMSAFRSGHSPHHGFNATGIKCEAASASDPPPRDGAVEKATIEGLSSPQLPGSYSHSTHVAP